MAVIGVDLGGTKVAGALFSDKGHLLKKEYRLLGGATGSAVGVLVAEMIVSLRAQRPDLPVEAVGICVPGIVYSKRGTVWAPNIPGWDNYPLKNDLQAVLGDASIKISIASDRTCYILGEVWKGAAQGCSDAIYLAVGTGMGQASCSTAASSTALTTSWALRAGWRWRPPTKRNLSRWAASSIMPPAAESGSRPGCCTVMNE